MKVTTVSLMSIHYIIGLVSTRYDTVQFCSNAAPLSTQIVAVRCKVCTGVAVQAKSGSVDNVTAIMLS